MGAIKGGLEGGEGAHRGHDDISHGPENGNGEEGWWSARSFRVGWREGMMAKKEGLGGDTPTADTMTSPMGPRTVLLLRDGGRDGEGKWGPKKGGWEGGQEGVSGYGDPHRGHDGITPGPEKGNGEKGWW